MNHLDNESVKFCSDIVLSLVSFFLPYSFSRKTGNFVIEGGHDIDQGLSCNFRELRSTTIKICWFFFFVFFFISVIMIMWPKKGI